MQEDQLDQDATEGQKEGRSRASSGLDLGIYGRGQPVSGIGPTELIASGLSVAWLLLVGLFYLVLGPDDTVASSAWGTVMTALGVVLPLVVIWIAATTAKAVRTMREEARQLRAAVDTMRQTQTQQKAASLMTRSPLGRQAEAPSRAGDATGAAAVPRADAALAAKSDAKAVVPPRQPVAGEAQAGLALGAVAEDNRVPISIADFIRAIDFPESADDAEGVRALKVALADPMVTKLIRAAQDVLTLLSQDGIYMDDLKPDRPRPEYWRKFAQGMRGRDIAPLGGVRERTSLETSAVRMREDTIFRDAAHHFLRQFDRIFSEFEKNATDAEIVELANTRTARAFMLLGRVTGTFD